MQTQSKFRLLVVRLGAMGDILHALPAVTALRIAHPEWMIDWVVEPTWRALLAAEAESWPRHRQRIVPCSRSSIASTSRRPSSGAEIRSPRKLAAKSMHFVVHSKTNATMPCSIFRERCVRRSSPAWHRAGALIGESDPREAIARWLFTERIDTHTAHVIEQDLELASAVAGDTLTPVQPWLPVDPAAETWADANMLQPGEPTVLINPGAGWGAKRWPAERYAEVARALLNRGFRVLVNAGPGELILANSIIKKTGGGASLLLCSVEQLIAITRRINLVIAGDTGPLHLACALGRPVVGIYGPTDPSRNGPYGTNFKVLRSPESRRDHSRRDAPEAGLLTITPEDVLQAAEELLYSEASR